MIIDAYVHCARDKFLPVEELEKAMASAGIDACLLVQHMGQYNNSYHASIVRQQPEKYKAVCLVDTARRDAAEQLEGLLTGQAPEAVGISFVGVRMSAKMIREGPPCLDVLNRHKGTLVLHFPTGIGAHLVMLDQLAEDFPDVTIYVPHLGWPLHEKKASPSWHEAVRQLRQYPKMIFGLSAIYYYSSLPFPHEDVWPYLKHVINSIGAKRIVWSSGFPSLSGEETVIDDLKLFSGSTWGLAPHEREAILGGTASRCWGFGQ